MKHTILVIEQEAQYMQDSEAGGKQYWRGCLHPLRTISEFLIGRSERRAHDSQNAAVERLFAFAALQQNPGSDHVLLARPDSGIQRDTLAIAADALRSGDENADFLKWWLHTYGSQALPSAEHSACPVFSNYPAPTNEAELDSLEDKFNQRYPKVRMTRRHRKCCRIPGR